MTKHGKKYIQAFQKIDPQLRYSVVEACGLIPQTKVAQFNESVDVAIWLGVDPRHADQQVRGTVVLPHGTGKALRIAVFAKGQKAKEAEEAGADIVGAEELAAQVDKGFLDFDSVIATPDMMAVVGKLGKILGPRGLMPNPKMGTVTMDVAKAVREIKAGKIEFKVDKNGNLHASIGRASFEPEKLNDNLKSLLEAVIRAKPQSAKGNFLKKISISTTMGPGIKIDVASAMLAVSA